jgi:Xaa-Pro dipeptidase
MPVGNGGKFTPEAKAIYELVLEMQQVRIINFLLRLFVNHSLSQQSFSILKPGAHWDTVQLTCHRVLVQGFQRLGIFKSPASSNSGSWNSADAILASGDSAAFFPHGVGHSLGLDVHDVPAVSKPRSNETIEKLRKTEASGFGHENCYTYLRLRLPLQTGMVVVSRIFFFA